MSESAEEMGTFPENGLVLDSVCWDWLRSVLACCFVVTGYTQVDAGNCLTGELLLLASAVVLVLVQVGQVSACAPTCPGDHFCTWTICTSNSQSQFPPPAKAPTSTGYNVQVISELG